MSEQAERYKAQGNAALTARRFAEAAELYSSAIALEPSNATYFSNRAAAHAALEDWQASLDDSHEVVTLRPEWAKGWVRRGGAFMGLKKHEEARKAYLKASQLEPGNAQIQQLLEGAEAAVAKAKERRWEDDLWSDDDDEGGAALLPSGPAPFSALSSRRRFLTSSVAPTTAALALTTTVLPALADSGPTPVLGGTEVSVVNATLELALGISAVSTGIVGFNRSKLEKKMAEEMRDAQTTIKGLREMAEAGEPLPDVCIVKGTLRAKGAPVTPVVESAPALRSLIGTVKQPTNAWLEVAQKFGTLASSPLREAVDKISGGQLSPEDVAFATEGESGAPLAVDAASLASRKSGVTAGTPFVLSELLVQRLSPHAYETTEEDEDGKVTRRYNVRKPRAWSYNVHYVRQQSSGLKLEGKAGEQARVRLPDFQFRSGAAPPLFLPVADVLTEAVDDFLSSSSKRQLDDYTSPFTFLSSFLALDVMSATDDGGSFQSQEIDDVHTLDQLAAKSPSSEWVWNPHGFYDETKYALPTHAEASVIKYAELKRRMPEARMENMAATPYLKPDQSPMELNKARDSEFGWRVSEIAVPADASVALIAKPIYEPKVDAQNPIVLVDPFDANADGTIDMEEKLARKRSPWKFDMCFLTESVDELLVQKTANANAYIGLAVVGTLLAASALNDLSYAAAHPEAIVR